MAKNDKIKSLLVGMSYCSILFAVYSAADMQVQVQNFMYFNVLIIPETVCR